MLPQVPSFSFGAPKAGSASSAPAAPPKAAGNETASFGVSFAKAGSSASVAKAAAEQTLLASSAAEASKLPVPRINYITLPQQSDNTEPSADTPSDNAVASPETPSDKAEKSPDTSSASTSSATDPSDAEQAAAGWNWEQKKARPEQHLKGVTGTDAAKVSAGGVYGFDLGKVERISKRAIVLRLEPLKPGLPEFERVLSEERQSMTIGSMRGKVDLLVSDEAVSKKHATLSIVGIKGELALSVMDYSTNGTFVNGERLPEKQKRYRIRSGDKLTVKNKSLDEDFGWKCDFGNTVSFFSR